MFKDKILPITYESWDSDEGCNPILSEVNFLEVFGPWKEKEYCYKLKILYTEGKIIELGKDDKVIREICFGIVIKENVENEEEVAAAPASEVEVEVEPEAPQTQMFDV